MKIHRLCVALLFAQLSCSLVLFPTAASAEVQTIDFDTGTLGSPLNGQGDISFPLGQGFRPYRTDVGVRAHSGTSVGDLGRCAEETEASGGNAGSCEFFQARTTGVLSRTASSVTLFAGRFGPVGPFDPPEQATLTAFNARGDQLATTGPVPIGPAGFGTRLSVSNPSGNIARFTVKATSGANEFAGDLGIDDLSVSFASGGKPDFSLATVNQVLVLVQGQSIEVPVQINRLNGSSGPIDLSVTGLPPGVSAEPVTLTGTQTGAKITLTADTSAPDTKFVVVNATLTASPGGDANVGPASRTAALPVRVARDLELEFGGLKEGDLPKDGAVLVRMPDCAPLEMPVKIRRDIGMSRDISLRVRAQEMPPGTNVEILPDSVIPPGGNLVAERTLRFHSNLGRHLGLVPLVLEASAGPGTPVHKLSLSMIPAVPTASIETSGPGSSLVRTPRFGGRGTPVRITGNGFCPGTTVEVGNEKAIAETTIVDPHTIEFNVPRLATSGPLGIITPGGRVIFPAQGQLTVDSLRNTRGFQFENYALHHISLSELTEAFGADDLFVKVNPCWPWGECRVVTGILNPMAAIDWGVMNLGIELANVGRDDAGHCFGMSLTAREFATGKLSLRRFRSPAGLRVAKQVYELGEESGPASDLDSFLDAQQVKQFSAEVADAFFHRPRSLEAQLNMIREEFRHNRMVLVAAPAGPLGHAVLAYDLVETPDAADLFIYDPNRSFRSEDFNATKHEKRLAESVIHIDKVAKTWTLRAGTSSEKSGSAEGGLWVIPQDTIPDDPSLPGVGTLKQGLAWLLFGSTDGTVRTIADETFLPYFAGSDGPAGTGSFVGDPDKPLDVTFVGQEQGNYTQAFSAPGFTAALSEVATAKGVRDEVTGSADSLRFESGAARPLSIDLARQSSAALSTAATVDTHASAGGIASAGLGTDGTLSYAHDGAPTTIEFSLTTVRRNGGPASFASGPLPVGRGDRLRAEPLDRELRRVRLTIREADGRRSTRILHNRARPAVRLKLGTARIQRHHLTMKVRLSGHSRTILGVSLRLIRDGKVLARKSVALKGTARTRTISWRLPRSLRQGGYRLLADARAITSAGRGFTEAGSASAHRVARVWVGR